MRLRPDRESRVVSATRNSTALIGAVPRGQQCSRTPGQAYAPCSFRLACRFRLAWPTESYSTRGWSGSARPGAPHPDSEDLADRPGDEVLREAVSLIPGVHQLDPLLSVESRRLGEVSDQPVN